MVRILPSDARRRLLLVRIRLRARICSGRVAVSIDPSATIGRRIAFEVASGSFTSLRIGPGTRIGDGVRFRLHGGAIDIGPDCDIRAGCVLNVTGGTMRLVGPNTVSWSCVIHCAEDVHLSRWVYVGEGATIIDSSHYHSSPEEWSYRNSRSSAVWLGEDVWVCAKATITSGVRIGDRSIVAANSVVVKDSDEHQFLSGVPVREPRELAHPWVHGARDPG